ncbi:PIG-M-domain-containing protein [Geopyxis carbonaria]|nr:PIG-M-domain-containing protein [Geopyxis carbonaria]
MPHLTLPRLVLASALLRLAFFFYGLYQDAHSPLPYTDIDYHVFTQASLALSRGASPYTRETYRYTPLLAYALLPTVHWFSFGKLLFAAADLVAGIGIVRILRLQHVPEQRALRYAAACWLLNPMVATISTRGSSEGLLGVLVIALLWAAVARRWALAGVLLGVATHFKIYPVIYGPAILWWMSSDSPRPGAFLRGVVTARRAVFLLAAASTFTALNAAMWTRYGAEFTQHTFRHHVARLDHRHNFSAYNTLLHLVSSPQGHSPLPFAQYAFVPQMLLAAVLIPLACAKRDLAACLFAQTFAFVGWNKVVTSQYFMWYIVLLPFVLERSSFVERPRKGAAAVAAWVGAQAAWLAGAYRLEFGGESTYVPWLWAAGLVFFVVNVWVLGVVVGDIGTAPVVGGEVRGVAAVEVEKKRE